MNRQVYDSQAWRELPRDGECVVAYLFGDLAGECKGLTHRHHVVPDDPGSRSIQVCVRHHNRMHAALRRLLDGPEWRRCPHKPGVHRYPGAREECERRLNREFIAQFQMSSSSTSG